MTCPATNFAKGSFNNVTYALFTSYSSNSTTSPALHVPSAASGNNPFLAYGVINDGPSPGERSGDGAYIPARD